MAKRTRSGLKHLRASARRRQANAAVRSRIKTLLRAAHKASAQIPAAQAALDKAAARGVIHPNTAARQKSRLMRRLAAGQA